VSHDRYFLKRLATRVFEIDRGKLNVYEGDYNYYLEKTGREG
jgi:ATP-binding cassette subfamily F protein 3